MNIIRTKSIIKIMNIIKTIKSIIKNMNIITTRVLLKTRKLVKQEY